MLTIPLKSSHLYLCCPHEHGPSPSSPSERGASLCQSNSTFESSAHGACPNTCQRDDRDDPATGMMVEDFFGKNEEKTHDLFNSWDLHHHLLFISGISRRI